MKNYFATILVVDDDPNDLHLIEHALRHIGVTAPIHLCHGGLEAIAYMMGEGRYADRQKFAYPTFIITDLKMPGADGFAVLEHLKGNPEWAVIPTVVFSSSQDLDDIKKSYMLGASSYHVKQQTLEALRQQMKVLHEYWLTCEVPAVDSTGRQLETDSRGKLGERFAQPSNGANKGPAVNERVTNSNNNRSSDQIRELTCMEMDKPQTVLLIEDDENDIFFFQRALETNGLPFELQVARNGKEAQDYLMGEGQFSNRELFRFPKFIITDDKMPEVSGGTFLKWLKEHPQFHVVPTILLSGVAQPSAVLKAYEELGVHSYILKPNANAELEDALTLIFKYWAMCIVPPTKQENEERRHRAEVKSLMPQAPLVL